MALPAAPVAEWTDEAVLGYAVGKGDHALLRMADFDIRDYEKTRKALKGTWSRSKPETVERLKQEFLQAKRPLLSKLVELRANLAKAWREELRTASAAISIATGDSEKVMRDMLKETRRHGRKLEALVAKQTELNEECAEAVKLVDAAAEAGESANAIADGEEQIGTAAE